MWYTCRCWIQTVFRTSWPNETKGCQSEHDAMCINQWFSTFLCPWPNCDANSVATQNFHKSLLQKVRNLCMSLHYFHLSREGKRIITPRICEIFHYSDILFPEIIVRTFFLEIDVQSWEKFAKLEAISQIALENSACFEA